VGHTRNNESLNGKKVPSTGKNLEGKGVGTRENLSESSGECISVCGGKIKKPEKKK